MHSVLQTKLVLKFASVFVKDEGKAHMHSRFS
jgi:hypothetical protein